MLACVHSASVTCVDRAAQRYHWEVKVTDPASVPGGLVWVFLAEVAQDTINALRGLEDVTVTLVPMESAFPARQAGPELTVEYSGDPVSTHLSIRGQKLAGVLSVRLAVDTLAAECEVHVVDPDSISLSHHTGLAEKLRDTLNALQSVPRMKVVKVSADDVSEDVGTPPSQELKKDLTPASD